MWRSKFHLADYAVAHQALAPWDLKEADMVSQALGAKPNHEPDWHIHPCIEVDITSIIIIVAMAS
jgi:hypothetical protein